MTPEMGYFIIVDFLEGKEGKGGKGEKGEGQKREGKRGKTEAKGRKERAEGERDGKTGGEEGDPTLLVGEGGRKNEQCLKSKPLTSAIRIWNFFVKSLLLVLVRGL